MPVFISRTDGSKVGIAHAGWRGLAACIIENLVKSVDSKGEDLLVHFGPAISMSHFEVGEEIRSLYLSKNNNFERSFLLKNNKLYLDLYDAAKVIFEGFNLVSISGGDRCTFEESKHFFSYRRDGNNSGRMAHLVWME